MSVLLLTIYIILVFIRPMDWWYPVVGWPLVNPTAIATIGITLPQILARWKWIWDRVPVARLALALLGGVSISWIYPFWLTGMLTAFQEFGKVIVLFMLIVIIARDQKTWKFLTWTVLLCTAWMAVHSILQIHSGYGFGNKPPSPRAIYSPSGELLREVLQARAFGIFDDPNDLCLIFIVAIPILYAIVRSSRNFGVRVIAISLISMVGYAAWLTNSRGGVIGIFGMLVAHAIVRTKTYFRRWILASVSLAIVTVIAPARFSFAADASRADNWGEGILMFKKFPIFGVGWNAYPDYSSVHQVNHNTYITALCELGIVGYAPFFLLLYLTMVQLRKAINLRGRIDREAELYLSGLFSGLTGYLTSAYFLTRTYNPVLYVLIALAATETLIACTSESLYNSVYGTWRKDVRRGIIWCATSIMVIWFTVRICNLMLGR